MNKPLSAVPAQYAQPVAPLGLSDLLGDNRSVQGAEVLITSSLGKNERFQMPHLVGRRPLEYFPHGEFRGLFDFAAPDSALPSAGAIYVAA